MYSRPIQNAGRKASVSLSFRVRPGTITFVWLHTGHRKHAWAGVDRDPEYDFLERDSIRRRGSRKELLTMLDELGVAPLKVKI
jgi:hypothetical protein